jgi:ABC-type nitrate/sulfonate/bicarbonate transport system substrate-binding protein
VNRVLVALFTLLILHESAHAIDKVRIGFPDMAAQFMPVPLGQKLGFFQEEGLQAEFIRINPTPAMAALVSGELDYYTVIGTGVAAAIRGVPVKAVAAYVPGTPIALIARPEFKSVQELKGKSIGLLSLGTGLEAVARLIFKHFNIDPDRDVKFLVTGTIEGRFASMKQGLTAATLGSPPIDFQGKKLGFVVLARAHELFSYPISGLVASVKKITERPDEIKRVIKAGIKANRYINHNRDGTLEVMTAWLKINQEMAAATYDSLSQAFNDDGSLPEKGLRLVIEEAKRVGKVEREIALNEVADLSILREAQRELGIAAR